jgi:hypothetical protein
MRPGTQAPPALLAAALALAACSSHTVHYQNATDPTAGQAQFDRDKYECERESERPPNGPDEPTTASGMIIDPVQVQSCLSALGWHEDGK